MSCVCWYTLAVSAVTVYRESLCNNAEGIVITFVSVCLCVCVCKDRQLWTFFRIYTYNWVYSSSL